MASAIFHTAIEMDGQDHELHYSLAQVWAHGVRLRVCAQAGLRRWMSSSTWSAGQQC